MLHYLWGISKKVTIRLINYLLVTVLFVFGVILLSFALKLSGIDIVDALLVAAIVGFSGVIAVFIYRVHFKKHIYGYAAIDKRWWGLICDYIIIHFILHGTYLIYLASSGDFYLGFYETYHIAILKDRFSILRFELITLAHLLCLFNDF